MTVINSKAGDRVAAALHQMKSSFSHTLYADDPASCTRVGGCYCESAKERRRCFYWPMPTDG